MSARRSRSDAGWNALLAFSCIGILVASWFAFVRPKPHGDPMSHSMTSVQDILEATSEIEAHVATAQGHLMERTWDLSAEVFGSKILDALTRLAGKKHLQLAGFRMGKPFPAASLQEAPFIVIVEGAFTDVMAFVGDVEQPDSKVALSQLNCASGGSKDHVTATLSLTGFLYKGDK